jgi:hypothetical protein
MIDCLVAQTAIEGDVMLLRSDSDFVAMARVVPLKFYWDSMKIPSDQLLLGCFRHVSSGGES